jgi:hypothetical protein
MPLYSNSGNAKPDRRPGDVILEPLYLWLGGMEGLEANPFSGSSLPDPPRHPIKDKVAPK